MDSGVETILDSFENPILKNEINQPTSSLTFNIPNEFQS